MSLFTSDLWLMMNMLCFPLAVKLFRMLSTDSTANVSIPESIYSSRIRMFELMLLLYAMKSRNDKHVAISRRFFSPHEKFCSSQLPDSVMNV